MPTIFRNTFFDDGRARQRSSTPCAATARFVGPSGEVALKTTRPNVVVVILEGFRPHDHGCRHRWPAVMPNMRRLRDEGILVRELFANSFRTDRGEVAVAGFQISGADAHVDHETSDSRSRNLPSLARSLAGEGAVATSFSYGGKPQFHQSGFVYVCHGLAATLAEGPAVRYAALRLGCDDAVMCDWFADRVIARRVGGRSWPDC